MAVSRAPPAKRARFELDSARAALERLPEGLMEGSMDEFLGEGGGGGEGADPVACRAAYVRHVLARAGAPPAAARDARGLFLAVEAATRGQAACDLWWLLRRSLATASSVRWGAAGPRPLVRLGRGPAAEERDTAATAFGRDNEPLARALVRACCVPPGDLPTPDGLLEGGGGGRADELGPVFVFDAAAGAAPAGAAAAAAEEHTCGLLIDPRTGALGASIDMLVCDRDARGELAPHPTQTSLGVFEIKCRAKYAFDPDDGGATARAYAALLAARSAAALRAFLRSVRRPGVEHCPPDGCPGAAEALASCAEAWAAPPPAGAAPARRCSEFDRRHLALNRSVTSRVWLFNEPAAHSGAIELAAWDTGETALEAPLFANPRHANFKQILVQSYVLAGYFPGRAAAPHLVTFIGRRRRAREQGPLAVRAGPGAEACAVPREGAVPVLLIATPVAVDGELAREALERPAREAFRAALGESWDRRRRAAGAAATAS
ncbi:deoxyribonuclease [Bubaline alphaherpesvirus 1]|uniref:Deoxyribonuclease n=1 Tax=Bubaline alphaherpesvirus 1 TaxID=202910 RepID=A0A1L5JKI5_9ALPH|nr:deoxyribonuclease [Bubaline alphaherpesvirus 1]APO15904.1 deoxyribonuclease [Bubaline alphaherpesvirus 1]WPD94506.1 UL12 [Bubaline alphaherpesvirus 1]